MTLLPQQAIHHVATPRPNRLATVPAFCLIAIGNSIHGIEWSEVMAEEGGSARVIIASGDYQVVVEAFAWRPDAESIGTQLAYEDGRLIGLERGRVFGLAKRRTSPPMLPRQRSLAPMVTPPLTYLGWK